MRTEKKNAQGKAVLAVRVRRFRRLSGGGLTASIGYLPVEVVQASSRVPFLDKSEKKCGGR